jgi:hypothetical protein
VITVFGTGSVDAVASAAHAALAFGTTYARTTTSLANG